MPTNYDLHVHPLPVCNFGEHEPHAPDCAGRARRVACGTIIDPLHPDFGMALCMHRKADPGVEGGGPVDEGDQPEAEPKPNNPPPGGSVELEEPAAEEETEEMSDSSGPQPDGSNSDPPGGVGSLPDSGGGETGEPPEDRNGYWWWLARLLLLPLLLAALALIGLIAKILKALGTFEALVELLERVWQALRDLLDRFPDPPRTDGPTDPPEEPEPEHDEPHGACELVSEPTVTLGKDGWTIAIPDGLTAWLVHEFKIRAEFGRDCRCCEYQQEIKGYFRVRHTNGVWEESELPLPRDETMSQTEFHIDGKRTPAFEYGRRHGQANIFEDKYLPQRDGGCVYLGYDLPGMRPLSEGEWVDIDLTFRGSVIDRCNDRVLWQDLWQLRTTGLIGRQPPSQPGGRGDFVYLEQPLPTGGPPVTPPVTPPTPPIPVAGGAPPGAPPASLPGEPENLPWRISVSDDDPCQPVKQQRMGGLLISVRGRCPSVRPCRLMKRRAGSTDPWVRVPANVEPATPGYEYRGAC